MNVRRRHFSAPCARRLIGGLPVCAAAAALLAGCVGDPVRSARVDPASPIAGDVTRIVKSNRSWPSFRDIPPKPTDVRPAQAFGVAATDVREARARLERETAPDTWSLTGTERFAARAGALADDDSVQARDTEDFARTARERATPPPPPR